MDVCHAPKNSVAPRIWIVANRIRHDCEVEKGPNRAYIERNAGPSVEAKARTMQSSEHALFRIVDALDMSCSNTTAIDENRQELSSGTICPKCTGIQRLVLSGRCMSGGLGWALTRCIRYPPTVST